MIASMVQRKGAQFLLTYLPESMAWMALMARVNGEGGKDAVPDVSGGMQCNLAAPACSEKSPLVISRLVLHFISRPHPSQLLVPALVHILSTISGIMYDLWTSFVRCYIVMGQQRRRTIDSPSKPAFVDTVE